MLVSAIFLSTSLSLPRSMPPPSSSLSHPSARRLCCCALAAPPRYTAIRRSSLTPLLSSSTRRQSLSDISAVRDASGQTPSRNASAVHGTDTTGGGFPLSAAACSAGSTAKASRRSVWRRCSRPRLVAASNCRKLTLRFRGRCCCLLKRVAMGLPQCDVFGCCAKRVCCFGQSAPSPSTIPVGSCQACCQHSPEATTSNANPF